MVSVTTQIIEVFASRVGVDGTALDTCETNGYPYEPSSPAENLDNSVDLWVLDHSGGEHHLTVTIRDNGTEMYSGEFDTCAGYDKAQCPRVAGEEDEQTVKLMSGDGATITESVTVREGVKKFTVRVTE